MQTPLSQFVETQVAAEPSMPLIHGTDMYHFSAIRKAGAIEPQRCPVFDEDLVYLFYGRPSYRVGLRSQPRRDLLYAPSCFVFSPRLANRPARIFPFDTGAYEAGLYARFLHADMKLTDFLVGTSWDSPGQVVSTFFGTNESYFHGNVRQNLRIALSAFEVQAYYSILSATGSDDGDDRAYTIEIQARTAIQISGNLIGVVLPSSAMDDPDIARVVQTEWRVPFLTYHAFPRLRMRPLEYHGQVLEKVYELLKGGGFL